MLEVSDDVRNTVRTTLNAFLDSIVSLRPDLHRYCRKLTGNIWDAEDLVQDTLLRGFASLSVAPWPVGNPRAYLIRIATNLWIDAQRRRAIESDILASEAILTSPTVQTPSDRAGVRNAAIRLFEQLAPQERAAIVLKDVFDMSLKDIAEILLTTENAVKAALHRGRTRLKDDTSPSARAASPSLIEKFVRCLDACDRDGMLALMLDSASIVMPPTLIETGRKEFERKGGWLWHAAQPPGERPVDMRQIKWANRLVEFEGETILLGLMPPSHGGTLQGINRFEEEDGKISRIRSYSFAPETVAEVAAAFGLTVGPIPYRFLMSSQAARPGSA